MMDAFANLMHETWIVALVAVIAFAIAGALYQRRAKNRPPDFKSLPAEWREILRRNVPFYDRLPARYRPVFNHQLRRFLEDKKFTAAGGFVITDEVRVTIAAAAVRLTLGLDASTYKRLSEIIVYVGDYLHPDEDPVYSGEAHEWGVIVLSWEAVLEGLAGSMEGEPDTATHEFAHALDRASGEFDGTPELRSFRDYPEWVETMSRRYLNLKRGRGRESRILDAYGARNEAEFFAVATEMFFSRPVLMRDSLPDLYRVLSRYFGQDPAREMPEMNPPGENEIAGRN